MTGPLHGFIVLELADGIAGPALGLQLAAAGADVIKVEPPEGDRTRGWVPVLGEGLSTPFVALNRNKRSICLEVQAEPPSGALISLLQRADIVIVDANDNRLTYERSRAVNPQIVYCSISGFGAEGPQADLAPGELPAQMMAEVTSSMGVIGEAPVRLGTDVASMYAAIYGVQAVAAALVARDRLGEGQFVVVSLFGGALAMRSTLWVARSNPDEWWGFHLDSYVKEPFRGYACGTGRIYFNLAHGGGTDLEALLQDLRMEWVKESPLYPQLLEDTGGPTGRYTDLVRPLWERAFAAFSSEQVIEIIERHGGTAFAVNDYQELLSGEQAAAAGVVREIEQPGVGPMKVVAPPWTFDGAELEEHLPAPRLGEHTEAILRELGGFSDQQISSLLTTARAVRTEPG